MKLADADRMENRLLVAIVTLALIDTTTAVFSPNVTISSCASRRVVIRLDHAADGGLLFIQGAGEVCTKSTVSDSMEHTFRFDLCNIEYDNKFRIVVQQNPHYQTGHDRVIPIMCLVDTGELMVSGVIYPSEKIDNEAINKTMRPTVVMSILTEVDKTSVNEVNLDDKIKMSLRLEDPYLRDFDIKAKDCLASQISLLKDECSSDEHLFPNFKREGKGELASAFQAFQPTSLIGQAEIDVAFACNVTVCKGKCHQTICGKVVGWGRKRRAEEDDVYERLTVGTKLRVRRPDPDTLAGGLKADKTYFCGEKIMVTSVSAVAIVTIVFSWLVCGFITAKLRRVSRTTSTGPKKPSALRRMSEKNINFARSVGRRLSTMLNIPVGYDMKDPKMMEDLPDMTSSPHSNRRESVTVRPSHDDDDGDVTYVSVLYADGSGNNCNLRKRLVDSSCQTDDVLSNSKFDLRDVKTKKNPFSFITSISIKSGISKQSNKRAGFANPAFQSRSFDYNPNKSVQNPNNDTNNANNDAQDNVVAYSADDLPRNRSVSAQNLETSYGNDNTPNAARRTRRVLMRSHTPPTDYDQDDVKNQDVSFNDGSMHNHDNSYACPELTAKANSAVASNGQHSAFDSKQATSLNLKRSVSGMDNSDNANSSVVQIGRSDNDVCPMANGRVTPVEDYYEPIEIGRKAQKLTRQTSTHV